MKFKQLKKIFSVLLLAMLLFTTLFSNFGSVNATQVGDSIQLVNRGTCDYHVMFLDSSGNNTYIITHYVGYYEGDVFHPAYCLDMYKDGISETLSYSVSVQEAMNNDAVWRVLQKGYPYGGTLGLSEQDAFFVTKQAIYSVLDGRDLNRYSAAASDTYGQTMVNKIKELAEYGRNGTDTRRTPVINFTTIKTADVDNIDSNYVSQVFKVDSPINAKDIRVYLNSEQAPSGSVLTDINNNAKNSFSKGEQFKVLIPRANITGDISIDISATADVETFPVFYSKAPDSAYQDYALVSDPFVLATANTNMKYKPSGKVEVDKVSSEYNQYTNLDAKTGLANAIFEIERIDGVKEYKKQFTTNEVGKINQELELGKYKVIEIQSPDYYVMNDENLTYEFTLSSDGQEVSIEFENDNVNLVVDVEKTGTIETTVGGEIEYNFDIQNKSNIAVDNFTWGDKLPSEVRINTLTTGTFNEDRDFVVQYITNNNSNWKTIAECNTQESSDIDFNSETLELAEDEYVTEVRFVFTDKVMPGFKNDGTKIITTVNDDVLNNQIIENYTYVSADYLQTKVHDEDIFHTIVKTPEKEKKTTLTGVLPRTGK